MKPSASFLQFLHTLLGSDNVRSDPTALAEYREDSTEIEPSEPDLVAWVSTAEQVQQIVSQAHASGVALTPRVYGTNVGGLAVPTEGGVVLDFTRMNRIIEVNAENMYAVIEPGVTQQDLKDYLIEHDIPLTLGYSLAPPSTSVFANALLGGLTNRSLKYGDQSEWVSGLEVVLPDGSVMRTGAWALDGVEPFGRVPFPDLSGLFFAWQGTTGIATRMAFQLWPAHPLNKRLFILTYSPRATFDAMRLLCRKEICDDIGGLSWPTGKMMMGIKRPHPSPATGEPQFFLYVDLTAEIPEQMAAKEKILMSVITELRQRGEPMEDPLEIGTLVSVNPAMAKFAEFPTDLEFLTDHGGGGLTWIGTYGPLSRFTPAAEDAIELMVSHGVPPTIVSRPMRGGHFGVLRFVTIFDKQDADEVERVRVLNRALLELMTGHGLVMYKTPIWAWSQLVDRIDPKMVEMMGRIKKLLDPQRIMNPGKLGL